MVVTKKIHFDTRGNGHIIDITPDVVKQLASAGLRNGTATVFITGSTTAVTTIEFEPGLLSDFKTMWERVIPKNIPYQHDAAWGESNGFSHVRASLLGPSLVIPVVEGVMVLGTWQQIVLIDFDHQPRSREVVLQFAGE
ncbi:MAG: secondary thiamine-phosphate synthase enzyme YjbQ [Chloroflexota bacterium]